jgi:hypothetical protein
MLKKYFLSVNVYVVLAFLVVSEIIFTFIVSKYALNDQVLYNSFGDELSIEEIKRFTSTTRANSTVSLLSSGAKVLVEVVIINVFIMIGVVLMRFAVSFKQAFNVVVKSYVIFSLSRLLLALIYSTTKVENYDDLDYIPRLSLYPFFNAATLPDWAIFPLQTINLLQLGFIALLALGLNIAKKHGYGKWLLMVFVTYGIMLVIELSLFIFWVGI